MEKEGKSLWGIEIFILLASLVFSVLFLVETYDMENVAAGLLPSIVATVNILFCLSIFIGKLVSMKRAKSSMIAKESEAGTESPGGQTRSLLSWGWSYMAMVGYFLFILLIGLLWATLLYTLVIPFLMHYKSWKVVVVTSFIVTASMYVSFCVVLKINLPTGILF